jgi:hypothetical protein
MNFGAVSAIAAAVLYEGYILYPYGPKALKNRQRWTFGGLFPRDYANSSGGDPWVAQVQCLLQGGADMVVEVRPRFLRIVTREIEAGEPLQPVPMLEVDGTRFLAWEEATEQDILVPPLPLPQLLAGGAEVPFHFPAEHHREPIWAKDGVVAGELVRSAESLSGRVVVAAEQVADDTVRLTVRVENLTPLAPAAQAARELAQGCSFASLHVLLGVATGVFISSIDPPPALAEAMAGCTNQGLWPVMVGASGTRDMMLAAPIILYDYPQIAAESAGDLFDATEIDEILSLRILTMTDDEKRDMAAADAHARALLERTERLGAADFARMHGTLRPPYMVGDRVRLQPRRRADIMDTVLRGKVAVIEAIERDFEDRVHLAVTLLDDPGRDLGLDRMPGHRFFFAPDEVEKLGAPP